MWLLGTLLSFLFPFLAALPTKPPETDGTTETCAGWPGALSTLP
jgi:hypothetical protein